MIDPGQDKPRWYHLTPGRIVVGLLLVEGFLWLSERFRWFAFNEHRGWTVLIAAAAVGAALLAMLLWFAAAVVFHRRFQFSILSLMVLTVVVAVLCGWLAPNWNGRGGSGRRWTSLRRPVGWLFTIMNGIRSAER